MIVDTVAGLIVFGSEVIVNGRNGLVIETRDGEVYVEFLSGKRKWFAIIDVRLR